MLKPQETKGKCLLLFSKKLKITKIAKLQTVSFFYIKFGGDRNGDGVMIHAPSNSIL
jgi:hypothetical protein